MMIETTERRQPDEGFPPELRAEMEEAVCQLMSGERDPEAMRQACERMDRMREENRERFGVQKIAVRLVPRHAAPETRSRSANRPWPRATFCGVMGN